MMIVGEWHRDLFMNKVTACAGDLHPDSLPWAHQMNKVKTLAAFRP
jgi:hypothetical protein